MKNIIITINNYLDGIIANNPRLKELNRREKISTSLKSYHKKYGNTRRVRFNYMGKRAGYIYLDR